MALTEKDKEGICDFVEAHKEEVVSFLREIVKRPSVSGRGEEAGSQACVASLMREAGFEVDVFEPDKVEGIGEHPDFQGGRIYSGRPNVVGIWRGSGGGRSILMVGHGDTVAVNFPWAWRHEPFGAEVEAGRIYGRGSNDNKAGVTAAMMAMKLLRDYGFSLRGVAYAASYIDHEEGGGGNSILASILRGYGADGGICCDAVDLEINPEYWGTDSYKVVLLVPALICGHGDTYEVLDTAVRRLQKLNRKLKLELDAHPLHGGASIGPGPLYFDRITVGATDGIEGIPDSVPAAALGLIAGDVWRLPEKSRQQLEAEMLTAIGDLGKGTEVRISWGKEAKLSATPRDADLVKIVAGAYRQAKRQEPKIVGTWGIDLAILHKHCTEALAIGPSPFNVPGGAHEIDECISIEERLIPHTKILALTIADWCG